MTRRERHKRIIENFGAFHPYAPFARQHVLDKFGLDAFTDEALEAFARDLWSSHVRQQRYNREWRARQKATA